MRNVEVSVSLNIGGMSSDKFKTYFALSPEPGFPEGLERSVLLAVQAAVKRRDRQMWFFIRLSTWISLSGFVFAVWFFGGAIARSDFWSLVRLVFSDGAAVLAYWQEFLLSLSETLPIVSLSVIFVATSAFAFSLSVHYEWVGRHQRYA